MRDSAKACFIDSEDVAADRGHVETATEARSACAAHARPSPGSSPRKACGRLRVKNTGTR
ncbi:hypothetical protein [Deinococcus altitudinis]|uniref:hypothetical protein n=1 Tax=Deinococcus altitudinis TaxID=468914 RepID=UPI0038919282